MRCSGHEKLDDFRIATECVGWAYRHCEALKGYCSVKDRVVPGWPAGQATIAQGSSNPGDTETDSDPAADRKKERTTAR